MSGNVSRDLPEVILHLLQPHILQLADAPHQAFVTTDLAKVTRYYVHRAAIVDVGPVTVAGGGILTMRPHVQDDLDEGDDQREQLRRHEEQRQKVDQMGATVVANSDLLWEGR